jgi:hypothetical protein
MKKGPNRGLILRQPRPIKLIHGFVVQAVAGSNPVVHPSEGPYGGGVLLYRLVVGLRSRTVSERVILPPFAGLNTSFSVSFTWPPRRSSCFA